jgi:hypothetical protein
LGERETGHSPQKLKFVGHNYAPGAFRLPEYFSYSLKHIFAGTTVCVDRKSVMIAEY